MKCSYLEDSETEPLIHRKHYNLHKRHDNQLEGARFTQQGTKRYKYGSSGKVGSQQAGVTAKRTSYFNTSTTVL